MSQADMHRNGIHRPVIALLTDFGDSHYVGQMKGVILGISPDCQLIDLTHQVPPQNIIAGAAMLVDCFDAMPMGAVVIAVVDPGVGTAREIVAVQVEGRTLIGPNNGLLSLVVAGRRVERVRLVDCEDLWRPQRSSTFHGRDIMAPVAARLASGGSIVDVGSRDTTLISLAVPPVVSDVNRLCGRVLFADSYGNLVTNIMVEHINAALDNRIHAFVISSKLASVTTGINHPAEGGNYDRATSLRFVRTYGDAKTGECVCLIGSSGRLEIAVVNGNAEKLFPDDSILVELKW